MALNAEVVLRDGELEAVAEKASADLAHLRWHWTLDESNPKRVSLREYAKSVGKSEGTIRKYANAHELVRTNGTHLEDALVLANLGAERATATEAVAKATGKALGTVDNAGHYRREVQEVIDTARERTERGGASFEEEVVAVAEWRQKARKAAESHDKDRKSRSGVRFIELEGHLAAAKRNLAEALTATEHVDYSDEEMELLRDSLERIKSLLTMIDLRLAGTPDIDWDAELAALIE